MHQGVAQPAGSQHQGAKHDHVATTSGQAQLHNYNATKTEQQDVEMQDVSEQNSTKFNATSADVDALIAEYAPKPPQSIADASKSSGQPAVADALKLPAAKDQSSSKAPTAKAKKGKGKVEKTLKLKLQDNEVSPDEKLASSPRYSFDIETRREQEREANTVQGEIEAQVTGPERGEVELADKTG